MLFDDGVDANDRIHVDSDGWTPLHRACSLGHLGIVDALLDSGADPAVTDRDNRTPMHNATLIGNLEIVASLSAFNPRRSNTMVRRRRLRASARTMLSRAGGWPLFCVAVILPCPQYGSCTERTLAEKYKHTDIVKLMDGDLSVLAMDDD